MSTETMRLERLAARLRACGFHVDVLAAVLRIQRGYGLGVVYYLGRDAPRGNEALRAEVGGLFDAVHAAGPAARRRKTRRHHGTA